MYSFKSRVRYSEIGYDKKITLPSIIDYFQDCSTFQTESLGIGMNYLDKIKRAWILSSWQIIVNDYPSLNEEITISTWAYDFKGLYGHRNFMMKGNKDKTLAYANSVWVYMNTETGLPTRVDKNLGKTFSLKEKLDMDYAPRKVSIPNNMESYDPFPIVRANIDTNKHVNNGQYVLMGEEFLPEDFIIKQMRADYRKAAKLGDIVVPKVTHDGETYIVVLSDLDGNPYATLEFKQQEE